MNTQNTLKHVLLTIVALAALSFQVLAQQEPPLGGFVKDLTLSLPEASDLNTQEESGFGVAMLVSFTEITNTTSKGAYIVYAVNSIESPGEVFPGKVYLVRDLNNDDVIGVNDGKYLLASGLPQINSVASVSKDKIVLGTTTGVVLVRLKDYKVVSIQRATVGYTDAILPFGDSVLYGQYSNVINRVNFANGEIKLEDESKAGIVGSCISLTTSGGFVYAVDPVNNLIHRYAKDGDKINFSQSKKFTHPYPYLLELKALGGGKFLALVPQNLLNYGMPTFVGSSFVSLLQIGPDDQFHEVGMIANPEDERALHAYYGPGQSVDVYPTESGQRYLTSSGGVPNTAINQWVSDHILISDAHGSNTLFMALKPSEKLGGFVVLK